MSRLEVSAEAIADLSFGFSFYRDEASLSDAQRFIFAARSAAELLSIFPALGVVYSPCSRFRKWRVPQFPYTIIYQELSDGVRIVRVIHSSRDVENLL